MKTTTFYSLLLLLMFGSVQLNAQDDPTTAYDFVKADCDGKMHHLFSELDSGNVVIFEFFMLSCSPCILAGKALDEMTASLKTKYGEKVRFYQMAFTKTYSCTQIKEWVSTNGFATSVAFDSGHIQVAYYGGMDMPTVAVVAGKNHDVLFLSDLEFFTTDTAIISKSIHTFFNTSGISNFESFNASVSVYPNPSSNNFTLSIDADKQERVKLSLSNLEGQTVAEFSDMHLKPGKHSETYTLPVLNSGLYLLKGEMNGHVFTKKINIINQ